MPHVGTTASGQRAAPWRSEGLHMETQNKFCTATCWVFEADSLPERFQHCLIYISQVLHIDLKWRLAVQRLCTNAIAAGQASVKILMVVHAL